MLTYLNSRFLGWYAIVNSNLKKKNRYLLIYLVDSCHDYILEVIVYQLTFVTWYSFLLTASAEADGGPEKTTGARSPQEEWGGGTHTRKRMGFASTFVFFLIRKNNFSLLCELYQVTALRRQVRPVSGKVSRKVSVPEPLQEPSHRATPGRMHTSGASNGARYCTWACVLRCVSHSLVLILTKEPCLSPQELSSTDGKYLPQQDSKGQMAVTGETCHWHHHAEDDHL